MSHNRDPQALPLARLSEVPADVLATVGDGEARGVTLGDGTEFVLVRRAGALHAYENRCPHQGTPLETFPNKFLNADGSLLICSTHGARFRVEDGLCISGPCKGDRLRRVVMPA
jgi:nitrite reductase/ring-hydroxylating ferredoxin subunit